MSHVATISLEVRDLDSLEQAAKRLGLELVRDQRTYRWYGQSVGNYPLPKGFTAADLGKCDHAVRIQGNRQAYEIGVCRKKDGTGYELLWDFWNGGFGLEAAVGKDASKLRQEYAVAVATKQAMAKGYRVQRVDQRDGKVVLRAVRS